MPTINQLVHKKRKDKVRKSKAPVLGVGLNTIKKKEKKMWNFMEINNFTHIIKQYIKAVETKHLKHRYTAPKLQAFFIQFLRILGF